MIIGKRHAHSAICIQAVAQLRNAAKVLAFVYALNLYKNFSCIYHDSYLRRIVVAIATEPMILISRSI